MSCHVMSCHVMSPPHTLRALSTLLTPSTSPMLPPCLALGLHILLSGMLPLQGDGTMPVRQPWSHSVMVALVARRTSARGGSCSTAFWSASPRASPRVGGCPLCATSHVAPLHGRDRAPLHVPLACACAPRMCPPHVPPPCAPPCAPPMCTPPCAPPHVHPPMCPC